ncbi:MAG: DUF1003 domain-containing protein [Rhodopila sp.]|nr:DUF1003 domain-containing protein [Rhodopila sp.]
MNAINNAVHRLHEDELKLLAQLRAARRQRVKVHEAVPSFGERVSDGVAAMVGSWTFIIIQSVLLILWMAANVTAYIQQWDPYPFILLNLVLSFQAAYAAPIIMMSQNRQAAIDRTEAKHDYDINIKAELEIELLHQKIDLLRETEIQQLTQVIQDLSDRLAAREAPVAST